MTAGTTQALQATTAAKPHPADAGCPRGRICVPRCLPLLGVVLLAAAGLRADLIETTDRRAIEGPVAAVSADGVRTAAGVTVPWAGVRRVVFDRPSVPAASVHLVLRDGTRLCGAVQRLGRERVAFRSVTAGELDLPLEQVAALQFADGAALEGVRGAAATNVVAVARSGLVRSGALLAASANNALLKGASGLEKFALDSLAGLVFAPVPADAGPAVRLRNGDRLCGAAQWADGTLKTAAGGAAVTVPLEALAEIRR